MHVRGKTTARFEEEILTFKPAEEERLRAYSQATDMIYSIQQGTEADLLVMQCASLLSISFSSHSFIRPHELPQTHS